VAVWLRGNAVAHINKVPGARHFSRYVTSHPGQLSLAIPSWVGAMSTSQMAVTLEVKELA